MPSHYRDKAMADRIARAMGEKGTLSSKEKELLKKKKKKKTRVLGEKGALSSQDAARIRKATPSMLGSGAAKKAAKTLKGRKKRIDKYLGNL